jgi:hypothetical protein
MPKDATKNVDRYKIRGGQLNEFDFHQNQEEFAGQPKAQATNLIPGTPPEARTEGIRPVVAAKTRTPAKKKPTKSTKAKATKAATAGKATKAKKATPTRGATAKKLAARKAAKKTKKPAKKK